MPYRRPPSSAPKPKPAPSPEDVHQGKHKPPHPPAPKPKPAPSPEDVHSGSHAPPHPPAPPRPPAWVKARQRRLRAAGFHVRVDGVWGPRSQHFWAQYQLGRRPGAATIPEFKPPKLSAAARQQFSVVNQLRRAAPEIQAGLPATKAHVEKVLAASTTPDLPDGRARGTTLRAETVDLAVARERRQAQAFAAKARRKPPEKMSLDDVVALTVDPLTGRLDPQRPSDVKRVQSWLRAHGHPHLKVDGTWGSHAFARNTRR